MTDEDDESSISVVDQESVDVVIMRGVDEGGLTTPLVSDSPLNLDSDEAVAPEVIADLLDSTVRLVAPTDVPLDVVDSIRQTPVPKTFETSSWLRDHRALIFRAGRCKVGALVMRYEPELGLFLDEIDELKT